jgi:hypothetical protein
MLNVAASSLASQLPQSLRWTHNGVNTLDHFGCGLARDGDSSNTAEMKA